MSIVGATDTKMRLLFLLFLSLSTGVDSFELAAETDAQFESSGRVERNAVRDTSCPSAFKGVCHCQKQPYPHMASDEKYVVNCTNSRFTDTDMLVELPIETEVLIFTGNMLNELEDNIFGFEIKHDQLNFIDFSNNHITFIRGQTFHRVKNVETLILNFNDMEITDRFERHRILSNFQNLRYLHLTDAFTDRYNASAYYLLRLEDIFIESNLTKLERLHLEQNEIASIGTNTSIFCPLKSLKQLYLSDNKLGDLDFKVDCLANLNHIDIRYNTITRLSDDAMERLDKFVDSGRPLSVNLMDNPLVCDCRSVNFLHWLKTSGVEMDKVENYVCKDAFIKEDIGKNIIDVSLETCFDSHSMILLDGYSSGTVGLLSFFIVFLILAVILVGFYHKKKLATYVQPLVNDLTRGDIHIFEEAVIIFHSTKKSSRHWVHNMIGSRKESEFREYYCTIKVDDLKLKEYTGLQKKVSIPSKEEGKQQIQSFTLSDETKAEGFFFTPKSYDRRVRLEEALENVRMMQIFKQRSEHSFISSTIALETILDDNFCDICANFLDGSYQQCNVCSKCNIKCHKICILAANEVPCQPNSTLELAGQVCWWGGEMSRADAEDLLDKSKFRDGQFVPGLFKMRWSVKMMSLVLSVIASNLKICHILVDSCDEFRLANFESSPSFPSVALLLKHYNQNNINSTLPAIDATLQICPNGCDKDMFIL